MASLKAMDGSIVEFFTPYKYPKPNMMVQEGTQVRIGGLQTEKGRQLNGRVGTATMFLPQENRWAVFVPLNASDAQNGENEVAETTGHDTNGKGGNVFKISIKNLTSTIPEQEEGFAVSILQRSNPSWEEMTRNGRLMVFNGTSGGKPCLMVAGVPNEPGFDKDRFYEDCSCMGISKNLAEGFVNFCCETPKSGNK